MAHGLQAVALATGILGAFALEYWAIELAVTKATELMVRWNLADEGFSASAGNILGNVGGAPLTYTFATAGMLAAVLLGAWLFHVVLRFRHA